MRSPLFAALALNRCASEELWTKVRKVGVNTVNTTRSYRCTACGSHVTWGQRRVHMLTKHLVSPHGLNLGEMFVYTPDVFQTVP